MKPNFYIVDVFAEQAYAGNPLAVVLGAESFDDELMQKLAAETNYSETTFVYSEQEKDGGYRTRLFTPAREIAFAGHPILGTAWVVRKAYARDNPATIRLNLDVGQVPVTFEPAAGAAEIVWFTAPAVTPGGTVDPSRIAAALGISVADIDIRFPVQQMAAGTSAMIVPLRSLDALRRCRLNLAAYAGLAADGFPPLVYLFCSETRHPGNDLSARFFFEAHGVREDPATGNGAAFLGAYLVKHQVFDPHKRAWRIEQGDEVRRPSLVQLRVGASAAGVEIQVGGKVIAAVQGSLV
ncbi:MAG: PhzF family phenazine biosynthesis protein [Rhodocyclales bacterium]|nr:PhzF family phenazine biosynthesis protein [Rhodocyclales bacterium]